MSSVPIVNIAAYKFLKLSDEDRAQLRDSFNQTCGNLDLLGTILLAPEGLNLFLAGTVESVATFCSHLRKYNRLSDIEIKTSYSKTRPFKKLAIKFKKEIITMGDPAIEPARHTGSRMSAEQLKSWLDENKDFTLLDTRNNYEIDFGTFQAAEHLRIDEFTEFPDAAKQMDPSLKEKPLVMFCTGGIRCEKASAVLMNEGFREVYQLDGGILKYFETVGSEHYDGRCFVFDERVSLDGQLTESDTITCPACKSDVTTKEQLSPEFKPDQRCPHCATSASDTSA